MGSCTQKTKATKQTQKTETENKRPSFYSFSKQNKLQPTSGQGNQLVEESKTPHQTPDEPSTIAFAQPQDIPNIHDSDHTMSLPDLQKQDSIVEGTHCNICYNIMVEPTGFNPYCSHTFCIQCVQKFLQHNSSCPNCRVQIPKTFIPKIDLEQQNRIKTLYKDEYLSRYKELELRGELIGEQITIEFEIGNHYKYLDKPIQSQNGKDDITMQCTPFVRFKDKACGPLIGLFISDVTFKLCRCSNENCGNNISKRPKCNNCESCLKKQNGEYVEPDYEVSATLNCWQILKDMPIEICFTRAISNSEEKKCKCCDRLQKSSFTHQNTTIDLQFEQDSRCETIQVLLNKNKVIKLLTDSNEKLGRNSALQEQQSAAEKKAIEYLMEKLLN